MFSYKFKNGTVATGTVEQIKAIADILGEALEGIEEIPVGWYPSSTKGLIRIADMNEKHIKNAINKIAYTYYLEIGKSDDTEEYLKKFVALAELPKLQELFNELIKRVKEHKASSK